MIGLVVATIGALNVFCPKKVWYIGQFMLRMKKGKLVFATSEPSRFMIILHRILGAFFLLLGISLVAADILDNFV